MNITEKRPKHEVKNQLCNIHKDVYLLKKYQHGRDLDAADSQEIDVLASVGLIKKGISFKRRKVTVKTSALGMKLIS